MNYLDYYHLDREPFSIMPITKFYYHSVQHDMALEKLKFAISSSKGLALLIGDVGTGKSLLARRLLDELPEEQYDASLLVILHSDVDPTWLLKRIAMQLGVKEPSGTRMEMLGQLYSKLVELADKKKRAVVLIDEVHMLRTRGVMEEFRGLLNLELPERKLINFVFFGLPEVERSLKRDPALYQRVAVRHVLQPFDQATTADYVRFRLAQAGSNKTLFDDAALVKVHEYSHGVPRLINIVCDNALFEGYVRHEEPPLGIDIVDSVATDLALRPAD